MYGKFHASTFTGSMRGAGVDKFAVWGWIIANTDQYSRVEINPDIVAFLLGTTADIVAKAVEFFCLPDPNSRNKDYDGCRLVKEGQFQYYVPSHLHYRSMHTTEEKREYNRLKQREYRESKKAVKPSVKNVKNVNASEAEAEAEAKAEVQVQNLVAVKSNPQVQNLDALGANTFKLESPSVDNRPPSSDQEWMAVLRKSSAYEGINIDAELSKLQLWCASRRKKPTKRRFLAWLNNIEKPLQRTTPDYSKGF